MEQHTLGLHTFVPQFTSISSCLARREEVRRTGPASSKQVHYARPRHFGRENSGANGVHKERHCFISPQDEHVSRELTQFRIRGSEGLDQFPASIGIGVFPPDDSASQHVLGIHIAVV